MNVLQIAAILACFVICLSGCETSEPISRPTVKDASPTPVKTPESPRVGDAIASLKKIVAATQVGVTQYKLSELLIDAQARVNDANEELPNGPLKTELNQALDGYKGCLAYWRRFSEGMDGEFPPSGPECFSKAERHVVQASEYKNQKR